MTTEPGFTPIFGPNGAVLNAPTMTPEMRAKFNESEKVPLREVLLGAAWLLAVVGAGALAVLLFGKPIRQLALTSPWWGGAFTGAAVMLMIVALWGATRLSLERWEFIGRKDRVLTMPLWARTSLVATDIIASAALGSALVTFVASLGQETLGGGDFIPLWFVAQAIGALIRWIARKRG